ncbi:MAG TPA: ATP-dependent DNA helicase RecQ [Flavisolibacter sp.]|nr:ATP-dependent DNA helicase RecQ [Flavisolibacter sp.]
MTDPISILKKYWGFDQFRPLQEDIINAVLSGQDALALLPTGGGKSICYQVPALAKPGLCLVISPLIALMKDQVENLKARGIPALSIYSGQSRRQIKQTLENAAYGAYKLLYVSPERLETDLFREYLPALGVSLIAVDEAHCISQWGYDFRPSYLKIAALRKELPNTPVLALTASATKEVQQDICTKLGFEDQGIFMQSYERKNLSYSAFKVEAKGSRLVDIVSKVPGTAIIYCRSRKRTLEVANLLQMHGTSAQYYHAGLDSDERERRQQEWIDDRVQVMVCTNAFGMGIDKPGVRLVVHIDMPDCLENYYQEAGRAGRDGKRAYAVLLWTEKDITELAQLHETRYPTLEQIRNVYSALVNYLQVPLHYGEEQAYPFAFEPFVRNFGLNATVALHGLKALEADGWIYLNEKNFSPATVVFTTEKELLRDFAAAHPATETLLTTLLRTYEGIFHYPAYISEGLLARLLRQSEDEIKKGLLMLHSFSIIKYVPQDTKPRIIFREKRPAVQDLTLNLKEYNLRKEAFIKRTDHMAAYIRTDTCRSTYINEYFGDKTLPCGRCDVCLATRAGELTTVEFSLISDRIREVLLKKNSSPEELLKSLHGVRKEKAWKVIQFLQGENQLVLDTNGHLVLKGK